MGRLLTSEDIAPDNHNFWWFYLTGFRGWDPVQEMNLDEVLETLVDTEAMVPDFPGWYRAFCPQEGADRDGLYQQPNAVAGRLTPAMRFAVEFHRSETTYYLNDRYIGNLGGHFEAWFLTLEELRRFACHNLLGLLLLPMVGVEAGQRREAEELVREQLRLLPLFRDQAEPIASLVVNGLLMDGVFRRDPELGLVNSQNHSVRNLEGYPRYREDVVALNRELEEFLAPA